MKNDKIAVEKGGVDEFCIDFINCENFHDREESTF